MNQHCYGQQNILDKADIKYKWNHIGHKHSGYWNIDVTYNGKVRWICGGEIGYFSPNCLRGPAAIHNLRSSLCFKKYIYIFFKEKHVYASSTCNACCRCGANIFNDQLIKAWVFLKITCRCFGARLELNSVGRWTSKSRFVYPCCRTKLKIKSSKPCCTGKTPSVFCWWCSCSLCGDADPSWLVRLRRCSS